MFKKMASFVLAAAMMVGTAAFTAGAAETDAEEVAAENSAVVSADNSSEVGADSSSEVGAGNVLNFDTASAGWKNFKKVYCHIYLYGGDALADWQTKKEACSDDDNDGVWTYDLSKKGFTLESGKLYAVIFSNDLAAQTYDLLFDTSCFGKTAYCDGTTYENPVDSNKTGLAAFWKGVDKTKFGPLKQVTSIGNVVGTCIPSTTSAYKMFTDFLTNNLDSAKQYSGKNDQKLIDDTAKALGLYQGDVEQAIKETKVKVSWSKSKSSLPSGENPTAHKTSSGKSDGSGSGSGSSGNSSSGGSSSGSGSGSGSGSSSVSSGQETTIFFVFGGLMLAAAGVVFLARKKREE